MVRSRLRHVLLVLAVAGCLHGCADGAAPVAAPDRDPAGGAAGPPSGHPEAVTPLDVDEPTPESRSLIATATVEAVEVRPVPEQGSEPVHVLDHPTERGAPRTFLVERRQGAWLQVLLPVRPNGSTGWIRAADVELTRTGYAVAVDLAAFELQVTKDGEQVLSTPIAYGTADTPTPGGRYYITELLQPPDPDGVYGSFAFGLSGFSDVLLSFAGGEGVIGIHGTNDPASIGTRVSAGCIRVPDDVIVELAGILPLGTPVTIAG